MKKLLLLGSSGWVSHYVIPELQNLDLEVIGVSHTKEPQHNIENHHLDLASGDFVKKISEIECEYVLNMLASDQFDRMDIINKELADHCKENNIHYTFMSSANALDGDPSRIYYESDPPHGGSDYGKHKANCEKELLENYPSFLAIRFPMTHGFAPNREARTQEFLETLNQGKEFPSYMGLPQNRPFVGDLAMMISRIVVDRQQGIFHLGTHDVMEEIDFLRALASTFGHDSSLVVEGEKVDFNITVMPKKIYEIYGETYKFDHKRTIEKVRSQKELHQYLKA